MLRSLSARGSQGRPPAQHAYGYGCLCYDGWELGTAANPNCIHCKFVRLHFVFHPRTYNLELCYKNKRFQKHESKVELG